MLAALIFCVWPVAFAAAPIVGTGSTTSCDEAALDRALAEGGNVTFDCGGAAVIAITSVKSIAIDTSLHGGGAVTLSGGNTVQVFRVEFGARLELDGVRIADGYADLDAGGGIRNLGTLIAHQATFANNATRSFGGAIANEGECFVTDSLLVGNTGGSGGGAIANFRALTVQRTTFLGNTSGLFVVPGQEEPGSGGAVANYGVLTLSNSTLTANIAVANSRTGLSGTGAGLYSPGDAELSNCTIARNRVIRRLGFGDGGEPGACAGVDNGGALRIRNSIIADTNGSGCCSSGVVAGDSSNNIADDKGTLTFCGPSFTAVRPEALRLSGLEDNGGPTPTKALRPGSAAIAGGDAGTCVHDATVDGVDQRGVARFAPGDFTCDVGAFETSYAGSPPVPPATFLSLHGEPGDYIVGDQLIMVAPADGRFSSEYTRGIVHVSYFGNVPGSFWDVFFVAPAGRDLTTGDYTVAANSESALLNVGGDGRGCGYATGRFTLREATYALDGAVETFAVDFEQHCEDSPAALFGSLRINSDLPPSSPHIPPTPTPTPISIGMCVGDCAADGRVSIGDLIRGIAIALGETSLSECLSFDENHDGEVTIAELLRGVAGALNGCRS